MSNFSKKVSTTATNRLKQDFLRLNKDPVPYVRAVPLPNNILTWHYVVTGPENSLYEGGYFHGKLVFPKEFPFKPPAIYMITPNGRFEVNKKLCLRWLCFLQISFTNFIIIKQCLIFFIVKHFGFSSRYLESIMECVHNSNRFA